MREMGRRGGRKVGESEMVFDTFEQWSFGRSVGASFGARRAGMSDGAVMLLEGFGCSYALRSFFHLALESSFGVV